MWVSGGHSLELPILQGYMFALPQKGLIQLLSLQGQQCG